MPDKPSRIVIDITRENFPHYFDQLQKLADTAAEDATHWQKEHGLPPEIGEAVGYALLLDAIQKLEIHKADVRKSTQDCARITHMSQTPDGTRRLDAISPRQSDTRSSHLN